MTSWGTPVSYWSINSSYSIRRLGTRRSQLNTFLSSKRLNATKSIHLLSSKRVVTSYTKILLRIVSIVTATSLKIQSPHTARHSPLARLTASYPWVLIYLINKKAKKIAKWSWSKKVTINTMEWTFKQSRVWRCSQRKDRLHPNQRALVSAQTK